VLKTLHLFEQPDTLGRAVRWAFDGPQLLVVPRAGEWGNAFYERESRSLQLFYVTPQPGRTIYACHSMDILAHETAHAVLDGVAPDLYDALLPESLALHEAVADLTTLLMAFSSRKLAERVLAQTRGSIEQPSAFTDIAEQFGAAIHPGQEGLRNLFNDRTMKTVDTTEPHALSEVLSGALYRVMVRIHESLKDEAADRGMRRSRLIVPEEVVQWQREAPDAEEAFRAERARLGSDRDGKRRVSATRALWVAAQRFKRTVLRALDYLPPGEVTFADYGRAIVASDQASHPDSGGQREWLKDEFTERGIVGSRKDLDVATNYREPAVAKLDLRELVESDWLAYEFANQARGLLAIPKGIPFKVGPRLDVTKTYYHRDREVDRVRECLFKVSWTETERNGRGAPVPSRQTRRGTMLAIDWESRQVRAVVTTGGRDADDRRQERRARDRMLARLLRAGALRLGAEAYGPDGALLRTVVPAEIVGRTLAVRGVGRTLHVTRGL
jgi:hypothetical protein